jgi:flavin reductase (DIM6/NTAB) family NADH-FMN oxidoreductase RutF
LEHIMTKLNPVQSGDAARDVANLRSLYGRYPTGVAAICALRDRNPVGIVATSFTPVSMEPALVSICVQHTSTTWPILSQEPHLGISILASTHQAACRQIAAKNVDRFAGVSWFTTDSGAVLLSDASAWLDCQISASILAGDHDVVVLEVNAALVNDEVAPLVFHNSRFRVLAHSETS